MYHAQEPGEYSRPEITGQRGGIHNSVTVSALNQLMIGGYAHQFMWVQLLWHSGL